MRPSRDRSKPIPGRTWYDGAWRTPEQIAHIREYQARYARERRARDPEYAERDRERMRARHRNTYVRKSQRAAPGTGTGVRKPRPSRAGKGNVRSVGPTMRSIPKPVDKPIPAVVREGWNKADENAAIRRRWPTKAALQKAANEGAFDAVRTYV